MDWFILGFEGMEALRKSEIGVNAVDKKGDFDRSGSAERKARGWESKGVDKFWNRW